MKTFPHRRTHCGAKGRLPRDQIKGREGDAGTDEDGWSGRDVGLSVRPIRSFLKDVLLDVPRPTLSRDDPSAEPEEERPVPRNMKITQDVPKKFGYTPGCAKCKKLSRNEYSHPGLALSHQN